MQIDETGPQHPQQHYTPTTTLSATKDHSKSNNDYNDYNDALRHHPARFGGAPLLRGGRLADL